ncbi:MAG: serine hydrolase [Cyanobacteria bacterium J007]|nr:MAG: serine hydrolase [Cyanobacteria bacterium J007]
MHKRRRKQHKQPKKPVAIAQRRQRRIALTSILALSVGMSMPDPQAQAPPKPPETSTTGVREAYRTADVPETPAFPPIVPIGDRAIAAYEKLSETLQEKQFELEGKLTGQPYWERALQRGKRATELAKSDLKEVDRLYEIKDLWEEAIALLEKIPPETPYRDRARQKLPEYRQNLAQIVYTLEVAKSDFLVPIARNSGLSDRVKITICHLHSGICRSLRGNEPAASAASLMKVPIVVALMDKLTRENIRFDTPIYVDPGNFTEDASEIRTGETYPIHKLLVETIAHSSNIAPNQLIDYLGWDYINQVLADRGYEVMRVHSKFVGDRIYPRNPGNRRNTITSDELTDMMMRLYNREHLGDEIILNALEKQYDLALGFEGLKGAFGNWLGEKTGQTSKVLGTTLAMNLFGETYIITVIDDGFYSEPSIRQFISEVAEYIFQSGQL